MISAESIVDLLLGGFRTIAEDEVNVVSASGENDWNIKLFLVGRRNIVGIIYLELVVNNKEVGNIIYFRIN